MTNEDNGHGSFSEDRGSVMRRWILRLSLEQPFAPFLIRLEGGFEAKVLSPESIVFEPGVLVAIVFDTPDVYQVFSLDRVVSVKVIV